MSKLGQRLIASAKEAVAIAEGRMAGRVVAPVDVAAIRKGLGLSQSGFARRFGLSAATVRDWEQGRRVPDRIARTLLMVIKEAPDVAEHASRPSPGESPRTAKIGGARPAAVPSRPQRPAALRRPPERA
jgi:putative transcriptional regulator